MMVAAKIVETVPWIDAKYYAATQTMDEARHTEVFAKYLAHEARRGVPDEPVPRGSRSTRCIEDSRWDIAYLGMQIVIESLALAAFGDMLRTHRGAAAQEAAALRDVRRGPPRRVRRAQPRASSTRASPTPSSRTARSSSLENTLRSRARSTTPEIWERMGVDVDDGAAVAARGGREARHAASSRASRTGSSPSSCRTCASSACSTPTTATCASGGARPACSSSSSPTTPATDYETYDEVAATAPPSAELTAGEVPMAIMRSTTVTDLVDELRDWLEENWDPDLTVGEWWERLGTVRLGRADACRPTATARACPAATRVRVAADHRRLRRARRARRAWASLLAAPTIATHGTHEQIERYVRDIVTGQQAWCQLFSEPGAGSDLAGLTTRGRAGRRRVDRQRPEGVDLGRPGRRPRHAARPHRPRRAQAPGHHLVRVRHAPARRRGPAAARDDRPRDVQRGVPHRRRRAATTRCIGGVNNGWAVANTTLLHERVGLGAGRRRRAASASARAPARSPATSTGGPATSCARPASRGRRRGGRRASARRRRATLIELATELGQGHTTRRSARSSCRLHTLSELRRLQRPSATRRCARPGRRHPRHRQHRQAARWPTSCGSPATSACSILGARGMLHAYDRRGSDALDEAHRQPGRARRSPAQAARRAGAADLRRHRPDPAQHHRRARARPPEGAGRPLATCRSTSCRRTADEHGHLARVLGNMRISRRRASEFRLGGRR